MRILIVFVTCLLSAFFTVAARANCGESILGSYASGVEPEKEQVIVCVKYGSVEEKSYLQSLFLVGLLNLEKFGINVNEILSGESAESSYKSYLISNYIIGDVESAAKYFVDSVNKKSKFANKDLSISILKREYKKIGKTSSFAGLYNSNYYIAMSVVDFVAKQKCNESYVFLPDQYNKNIENIFYSHPYISQAIKFFDQAECFDEENVNANLLRELDGDGGFFYTELSEVLRIKYGVKYSNTIESSEGWIKEHLYLIKDSPIGWCYENIPNYSDVVGQCVRYAFFDEYICSSYSTVSARIGRSNFIYDICRQSEVRKRHEK